jgi:hypothetical protein
MKLCDLQELVADAPPGAEHDAQQWLEAGSPRGGVAWSPLQFACALGDQELVAELLEREKASPTLPTSNANGTSKVSPTRVVYERTRGVTPDLDDADDVQVLAAAHRRTVRARGGRQDAAVRRSTSQRRCARRAGGLFLSFFDVLEALTGSDRADWVLSAAPSSAKWRHRDGARAHG